MLFVVYYLQDGIVGFVRNALTSCASRHRRVGARPRADAASDAVSVAARRWTGSGDRARAPRAC